jgi:intracellular sulfur oxidation DsrE/DsrF family protein
MIIKILYDGNSILIQWGLYNCMGALRNHKVKEIEAYGIELEVCMNSLIPFLFIEPIQKV